jgi:hypothetical protein
MVLPVTAFDSSCCEVGAPLAAVAVKAVVSLLLAVSSWNAVGVSSAPSADWKVDSAPFRVPSAEIWLVTCCVWLLISVCCGPSLAATSSETRLLTLMTEPPAAPEELLLATETTGCVWATPEVVEPTVVILGASQNGTGGGAHWRPPLVTSTSDW